MPERRQLVSIFARTHPASPLPLPPCPVLLRLRIQYHLRDRGLQCRLVYGHMLGGARISNLVRNQA